MTEKRSQFGIKTLLLIMVFAALVWQVASLTYRAAMANTRVAEWLWFGGCSTALVALAVIPLIAVFRSKPGQFFGNLGLAIVCTFLALLLLLAFVAAGWQLWWPLLN